MGIGFEIVSRIKLKDGTFITEGSNVEYRLYSDTIDIPKYAKIIKIEENYIEVKKWNGETDEIATCDIKSIKLN